MKQRLCGASSIVDFSGISCFFIIPSLELIMSYFSDVILRSTNILVPVEFRITKSQKEDKLTTFLFSSLDLCRSHSH